MSELARLFQANFCASFYFYQESQITVINVRKNACSINKWIYETRDDSENNNGRNRQEPYNEFQGQHRRDQHLQYYRHSLYAYFRLYISTCNAWIRFTIHWRKSLCVCVRVFDRYIYSINNAWNRPTNERRMKKECHSHKPLFSVIIGLFSIIHCGCQYIDSIV